MKIQTDTLPTRRPTADARLTKREKQVLLLLGEGLSNKEIATRLFISKRTCDFHAENMYRKFGVSNRIQMLNLARRTGLIDLETSKEGQP